MPVPPLTYSQLVPSETKKPPAPFAATTLTDATPLIVPLAGVRTSVPVPVKLTVMCQPLGKVDARRAGDRDRRRGPGKPISVSLQSPVAIVGVTLDIGLTAGDLLQRASGGDYSAHDPAGGRNAGYRSTSRSLAAAVILPVASTVMLVAV